MRFSVKGMLAAVTVVALGCAALLHANEVWAGVVYVVAFLCLSMAVLGIIYRRGERRAFWIGFAIFGGAYALLIGANPTGQSARRTPLDAGLNRLHEKVARQEPRPPSPSEITDTPSGILLRDQLLLGVATPSKPSMQDFKNVGHPLLLLLFAYVGGLVGYFFHATNKDDPCA